MQVTVLYAYYRIDIMNKFLMLVLLSMVVNFNIKPNLISVFSVLGLNFIWLLFIMRQTKVPYTMYKVEDEVSTNKVIGREEIEEVVVSSNKDISRGLLFLSFVINCLVTIVNLVIKYIF